MSTPSDKDRQDQAGAGAAAQASLDRVLNTLEEMLQIDEPPAAPEMADDAREQTAGQQDEFGQLSIPLLDDVVELDPDSAVPVMLVPDMEHDLEVPSELDVDPQLVEEISRRLRNELEVIVQAGLERLTRKATHEIMSEVKAHLDIILPEIIAEIDAPPADDED